MKASDRLRELHALAEETGGYRRGMMNALPLIADVVQHAEQFALAYDERRASEFTDERYEEVLTALELLNEALSES